MVSSANLEGLLGSDTGSGGADGTVVVVVFRLSVRTNTGRPFIVGMLKYQGRYNGQHFANVNPLMGAAIHLVVTILVLVLSANLGLDYFRLKPGRLRVRSIIATVIALQTHTRRGKRWARRCARGRWERRGSSREWG